MQTLRDAKIKNECVAMSHYRIENQNSEIEGCQKCIKSLKQLKFNSQTG